ncbi:cyclic nucleotide-binding domain-containing protein [Terrarubrum flagellatum]|uniref:cyclic nucleotide-binding domain-containing protein n=1 Tax=Terrirubrum flagellatum TaxID=2895980 RepID=UPI003144FDDB
MTIETEVKTLRKLQMFNNLDVAKLKLVAMISDRVTFHAGEAIFRRGDAPEAAYIVLDGSVRIMKDGDHPEGGFEKSGVMLLGEVGILCGRRRSITIIATSTVTALRIEREDFTRLIRETPEFALAVMHQLAEQLDVGTQFVTEHMAQMAR